MAGALVCQVIRLTQLEQKLIWSSKLDFDGCLILRLHAVATEMAGPSPIVLTDSSVKRRGVASALANEPAGAKVLMLRRACANSDTSKSTLQTCCVCKGEPSPLVKTGLVADARPRSA